MLLIPFRIVITLVYTRIHSTCGDQFDLDRATSDRSRIECKGDRVNRCWDGIGCSKSKGGAGQDQHQSDDGQLVDFTVASELIKYPYIYYQDEFYQFRLYYKTIESGITEC